MTQKQERPVDIFQVCRDIAKSKNKISDLLEVTHDEICHLIGAEAEAFQEAEFSGRLGLINELIAPQPKVPLLRVMQDIEDAMAAIQKANPLAEPAGGSIPDPLSLELIEFQVTQ